MSGTKDSDDEESHISGNLFFSNIRTVAADINIDVGKAVDAEAAAAATAMPSPVAAYNPWRRSVAVATGS